MNLTAGVHTIELLTTRPFGHASYVGKSSYDCSEQCYRTKVNPHKYSKGFDGRFITVYGSLSALSDVMSRIYGEQFIDSSSFKGYKRIDLCVDADVPYSETVRICRLLLLAIAHEHEADNNYLSIEPISGEQKTMRISKKWQNTRHSLYEVEHYDRSQIYQLNYDVNIINRLEFRLMGRKIEHVQTVKQLIEIWQCMINDAVNPASFEALEESLAIKVWAKCESLGLPVRNVVSVFADWILTRRQVELIYSYAGLKPDSGRKRASAHKLELFAYDKLCLFKDNILKSLDEFVRN